MKKNKSLKVFNFVAKRVHKLSKKQGLGFSWQQSQKFTSANLFKQFKGKPVSKIKVTDIDKIANGFLASQAKNEGTLAVSQTYTGEVCFNVDLVPDALLEPINWWDLVDAIDLFDPNLKMALEFGTVASTGIVKKMNLPSIIDIREDFRNVKFSSDNMIIFKKLQVPNTKDKSNPCSWYILVTLEGSLIDTETIGDEKEGFVRTEDLPKITQEEIAEKIAKQDELKKAKRTKKHIKSIGRPNQLEITPSVESITSAKTASTDDVRLLELQVENRKQINESLDRLQKNLDNKQITKKHFLKMQEILFSKMLKGGVI